MDYNKLVRDRMPEILEARNIPFETRILDDAEYKTELIKKLQEEVSEFIENPSAEELADIMEVVRALRHLPDFDEAKAIQRSKREERGGFTDKIMMKGTIQ